MGYFNFFYKLSMLFSNKKRLKIFIVIGLIFLFIFACSHGVFASSATEISPENNLVLMNYQLALQDSMISYLEFLYTTQPTGFNKTNADLMLNSMRYNEIVVIPSTELYGIWDVYIYMPNTSADHMIVFNTDADWSINFNQSTQYPCKVGILEECKTVYNVRNIWRTAQPTPAYTANPTAPYIPEPFYLVRSNRVNEFLKARGLISDIQPTYSTSDEELQAITRSGFQNLNSNIQQQTQQMTNSINEASTSITNSVDNLNNTITDTATDDSQVQLAQDNNQDLTNGFFTGLYDSFENAFVDTSYKFIQFPIPFTNKKITFSSSYVLDNIKRNSKFSVLVSLAESAWWFGLGYFVLLDIYKKINAIKSGDLTNIENENITTNLL